MDCRLQQRCMCLSFKRHRELLPPPPLFFFPPPRHLILLRHSYKQAAETPAHGDAGGGGGGQGEDLFPRVWSRRCSKRCKEETCRFFKKKTGTGTAPGAAPGAGSCPPPGRGSGLTPPSHLAVHRGHRSPSAPLPLLPGA